MGDETAADNFLSDSNEFISKPRYHRFLIALAGPVMNVVLAVVLLAGLYMSGVPAQMGPGIRTTGLVEGIVNGSPAQAAGIQAGDNVVRVQGIDVASSGRTVQEIVQDVPGETLRIGVLRNGRELEFEIQPVIEKGEAGEKGEKGQRRLGVYFQIATVSMKLGFVEAVNESIRTNEQYAFQILDVLGKLMRGAAALNQLEGPVGIVRATRQAANDSAAALLMLMAFISLNLGIMNLLPIPILDGGTMLILLVEALMGRDVSLIVKERIMQAGLLLLLIVFVVVLYSDVIRWTLPSAL